MVRVRRRALTFNHQTDAKRSLVERVLQQATREGVRSFRCDSGWKDAARLLFGLAVATAVSLVAFFASLVPVFIRPGPPILLGLSERILLGLYVVWLAAVAINLPASRDSRMTTQ